MMTTSSACTARFTKGISTALPGSPLKPPISSPECSTLILALGSASPRLRSPHGTTSTSPLLLLLSPSQNCLIRMTRTRTMMRARKMENQATSPSVSARTKRKQRGRL
uniref:Uncharacterized protein n=1 Tax=Opuntia streptacantha TaxID=393608 RepID=A0A7C9A4N5_OPUST